MKGFLMLVGRLLFALPFGVFGLFHFLNAKEMAQKVIPAFPAPELLVYFTGASLVIAFIFIFFKIKYAGLVALLLGVMLLCFVFLLHLPLVLAGGAGAQTAMISLLKDASLAGAAFFVAGTLSEK